MLAGYRLTHKETLNATDTGKKEKRKEKQNQTNTFDMQV